MKKYKNYVNLLPRKEVDIIKKIIFITSMLLIVHFFLINNKNLIQESNCPKDKINQDTKQISKSENFKEEIITEITSSESEELSTEVVEKTEIVSSSIKETVENKDNTNLNLNSSKTQNPKEKLDDENKVNNNESENCNVIVSTENDNTEDTYENNELEDSTTRVETQKTAWEILGISQYEYENATLYDGEEISFKDIEQCESEAERINKTYGFVTNYGYTSGKYLNNVGCWVKVYVDGTKYYLSQFNNLNIQTEHQ